MCVYLPTGPAWRKSSHRVGSVTLSSRPPTYTVASERRGDTLISSSCTQTGDSHPDSFLELVQQPCLYNSKRSKRLQHMEGAQQFVSEDKLGRAWPDYWVGRSLVGQWVKQSVEDRKVSSSNLISSKISKSSSISKLQ